MVKNIILLVTSLIVISQILATQANPHNKFRPRNCLEIQRSVENVALLDSTLTYEIYPTPSSSPLKVRCDFETDAGGWTLIQSRSSGPMYDFYRGWNEYDRGFGSPSGNHWIGLQSIYNLTTQGLPQELRVDLGDWEGNVAYAEYNEFSVADASDFYRLHLSGYSGNAGDSMMEANIGIANNMRFSTADSDHDMTSGENCAEYWEGAWWFNSCYDAHLNGRYYDGNNGDTWGMAWESWKGYYSLKTASMQIRDAEFKKTLKL